MSNRPWMPLALVAFAVPLLAPCPTAFADDWPQWMGPRRDGVWREDGIVEKFPDGGPKVRWRAPVAGGYAGPAVAGGRVYVTDWVPKPGGEKQGDPFNRKSRAGTERVLCFNEADGKPLWTHEYDCPYTVSYGSGPRCTPIVDGDRVYTLGSEGHLLCLDAKTGKVRWEKRLAGGEEAPVPLWGFSAHPLIDGDKLITLTAGKGAVVAAFNKHTGEKIWSALSAREPGYAPPVLYDPGRGGKRQLIVWHPESLNSVDPETGQPNWSEKFGPVQNGVSVVTPLLIRHATHGDLVLISSPNEGTLVMKLDPKDPKVAKVFWKRAAKESLNLLMAPPVAQGDHVYGLDYGGRLRCIELATGDVKWETYDAVQGGEDPVQFATAFLVPLGDSGRFFIPNEQGELVIAQLTPAGYQQLDRALVLKPTNMDARRPTLWCHPAFANRSMYWRNDKEMVCVDLGATADEKVTR